MRAKIAVVLASLGLLVAAASLTAHHSFAAEFDANQPLKIRGTVVQMDWVNPHSWIHMDVKKDDGTVERWMVEGPTPNTLFRRGFTKDSLKSGMELIVEGYRAKNGARRLNGRDVMLPDGKRVFLGSSGTGAPSDGRDPSEK